jgi:hypothetical protein
MRLLVDEDTASATLITRLLAVGYEVVQVPHGTSDEVVFNEAQRLALGVLPRSRHTVPEVALDRDNSSSSALASWRSAVSKPSVNQP